MNSINELYCPFEYVEDDYDDEFTLLSESDILYDETYYPDLCGLDIDTILTQDDPPKELYLQNVSNSTSDKFKDSEAVLLEVLSEQYAIELEPSFCIYEHFGIYSDISDAEAEGLLEAAQGSS